MYLESSFLICAVQLEDVLSFIASCLVMMFLRKKAGGVSGVEAIMAQKVFSIWMWRYTSMGGEPDRRWIAGIAVLLGRCCKQRVLPVEFRQFVDFTMV